MLEKYSLRKGDTGQEVKRLQQKLGLIIDGNFGVKTDKAVKDYQKAECLVEDGIAGISTLSSLLIPVLPGVDLSRHNGTVDFASLSASGCKYAWIKVTEGTTHTNPGFEKKFKDARDNGIIVGAYHFGRPDTGSDNLKDAKNEADHFLNTVSKAGIYTGDLIPVIDLEAGMKTDDQHNVDWNLEWLKEVEKVYLTKPMIYTAKWATNMYVSRASKASLKELSEYPLWWASYNTGSTPKRPPKIWSEWDVWQWTGHGSVPGVKGRCDQNWMAGGKLSSLLVP